jgi:phosphate starvation-inducible membrane PsiE
MMERGAMAHFRFGGGATGTLLHPLVAVGMLIAILLILTLPRSKAVTPFLLAYFTIPVGQVVVLGGLHFTVLQILILTVLARMAFRGSSSQGKFAGGFNALDRVVVLWSLLELIALVVQWMDTQALIKGLGDLVVYLGGYLAARFLIPDREAVQRMFKVLAVICVTQGVCMINEQISHINVFGLLGGIPLAATVREGHIRASGWAGGLVAGPFAGVLMPVFLWLWTREKSRMAACAGLAGATAMVFTSNASTALSAYGASLLGLGFWPLRKRMRLVRWGIVATLVGLHLVMHGPVWSLIEHIDLTGGSSSYHRYMLVDNCIRHFGDWWLIGYKYYGDWGFDMWDLCNQFVVAALTGGLVALILYIAIFSRSFGAIGTARKRVAGDRGQEWLLWCLGSSLFANVVASFGINYMFQLIMCLYCLLACISMATFEARQATVRRVVPYASAPGAVQEYVTAEGLTS